MSDLAQRFIDIKSQIGGNREKRQFEYTFGTPLETQYGVAMPADHIRRILAETEFALKLSQANARKFDGEISVALDVMESALAMDGTLTKRAAQEAEGALMPLEAAAKEYEVICAAHAHIDMNWMWGWQETVAAALSTFRTMLNLMKEYPNFCFSQSQASAYKIVEEYDPDMMREIQARIREGRWEVTASAWVETDKNMPDTESLLRHIKLTREYLSSVWGVPGESLNIDFSPDTFGHSEFIPEIDAFGGVNYMYHCRGLVTDDVAYRWRAPSGAELLAYCEPYWYNGGITPDAGTGAIELARHSGGLKTSLTVYGVGNHGGGATRRDVERIIEMQAWPIFPRFKFGTFGEYFSKAEAVRDALTLRAGELNAIFTGCYSTQSRIKRGNRRCEAALLDAETLSAMAGSEFARNRSDKAWRNVLFTHFHDIITGSCVQASREYAMGLFSEAIAIANTASAAAMTRLGQMIDTSIYPLRDAPGSQSEGAGVGYGIEAYVGVPNPERGRGRTRVYAVYNPCATDRDEAVELTVWDWPFDMTRIEVLGADGKPVPFALLTSEREKYWDHLKIRLLARASVPALGYTTLAVTEKPATEYPTYRPHDTRVEAIHGDIVLENRHVKAVFSRLDGALKSFIDKPTGAEMLYAGKTGKLQLINTESATSNAWNIGRWLRASDMDETIALTPGGNALRGELTIKQRVLSSSVTTRISLDENASALKYEFEVDWNEASRGDTPVPVLVFSAPVGGDATLMDVPAGVLTRACAPQDLPSLTFAAVPKGERAAMLSSDCKYGYRNWDGDLSVTLINTANSPDPYPERGIHHITVWLGVEDASAMALKNSARLLNHPVCVCSTGIHAGELPTSEAVYSFSAQSSVLSSLSADGANIFINVVELEGRADEVKFTAKGAKRAILTDLDGRQIGQANVEAGVVGFSVKPYSINRVAIAR